MSRPGAIFLLLRGRTGRVTTAAAADPLNQLITKTNEAVVELLKVGSGPSGAFRTRESVLACEGNIEDIRFVVAALVLAAAAHTFTVTGRGQSEGGFANARPVAVVTIGVAPYTIELTKET